MNYSFSILAVSALLLLGGGCAKSPSTELTTIEPLPIGEYSDYAKSSTPDSLSINLKTGDDRLLPTVLEVHDGYATVFARTAETQLNIPFGWYGSETGGRSAFVLDDERTRLIFRIASLENAEWSVFKEGFVKTWLKNAGDLLSEENIRLYTLSDTQFYVVIRHMKTDGTSENGAINLVTFQPEYPDLYHSTLLVTADAETEGYLGLIGLVARDMKIQWETYD